MKSHNPYLPVISGLTTIGVLCTAFIITVGASAWLSLIILFVTALIGLLVGAIICDFINHVHKDSQADP